MSNSVQTVVSDGSLPLLDISFNYFDRTHVHVYFDNVEQTLGTTWSWVGSTDKEIQFSPAVADGVVVKVQRITPLESPRHVYSSPGNAPFNKSTVDENFRQTLYAAQEAQEGANLTQLQQDLDAQGNKITDLGDALLDGDAVNLKVLREYLPYGPAATSLNARIAAEEAHTAALAGQYGSSLIGAATYAQLRAYTGSATRMQVGGRTHYFDKAAGTFVRTGSAPDNDGTVLVDALGRSWVRDYTGGINAVWFGVTPSPTDVRLSLIHAMDVAVAEGKTLLLGDGTYDCGDWVYPPSGLKMWCSPNSWLRLTSDTGPIGGFVIGGYTADLTKRPFANVEIHNLGLDCNNIAGENAFNAVEASNVKLFNPRIKNVLRSTTRLGGRAFQFEGGTIDGVHVYSPYLENCSIGINSQGRPDGSEVVRNINYFNVVMRDVDIPFNIDSQFANPETNTPSTMSTTVFGAELYDCGRITWPGDTSSGLGGGIVCGDRGSGLTIYDLRVINSATYGGIGSLTRGILYDVAIHGAEVYTSSMASVFDFTSVGFGSVAASAAPARVQAKGIKVVSNLDYVVKGGPSNDRVGASNLQVAINSTLASLTGIVDANAGTGTSGSAAYLNLTLLEQGFNETGLRNLANLYSSSNSIGECQPAVVSGAWVPTDASGAGLTLTVQGVSRYERRGRLTVAVVGLSYPVTADTSAARIGGLPFVAANFSNAAGSCAIGYQSASALANGYVQGNTNEIALTTSAGAPVTNAQMSGSTLYMTVTYIT